MVHLTDCHRHTPHPPIHPNRICYLSSSLFVTKKVQRRTLASAERIQMPYSHSTALALRAPPPVTVAFARPAPDMLLAYSLPVAGAGSQSNIGCETAARARPRWVLRTLSKPRRGVRREARGECRKEGASVPYM